MSWITPYLFRHYDVSAFNCWHLVCDVYKNQLGIELDEYNGVNPRDARAVGAQMDITFTNWLPCSLDTYLAVATMGRYRSPFHIGVVVSPGNVLHVVEGANARVQPIQELVTQGFNHIRYYRHAQSIPHC